MANMGEFVFKIVSEILLYLDKNQDKNPGIMNLVNDLGYHHRTISNYLNLLEKHGFIEIEPQINKNIIKLTDKGKCIIKCLES